jgi:hypothetical protein
MAMVFWTQKVVQSNRYLMLEYYTGSQLGMILHLGNIYLVMSEQTFGCHSLEGEAGFYWIEGKMLLNILSCKI